jgi:glycosyltransferase involved in cell wall biosynthesis
MPSENNMRASRPIRILHVAGTLNRGGIETWLREVVGRLPRERYQCDFCIYRIEGGAYAAELEHCGCALHYIPLGSSIPAIFHFAKRFRRLLREGRYDVVHCHGLLLVGFILSLAWLAKTPVRIAHAHNTDRKTGGAVSVANRLGLVLNRVLARAFSTHGVGCSAEAGVALFGWRWQEDTKYRLIHCGVNLTPFAVPVDGSVREGIGVPRDAKVIGHVGSFSVQKNHRFLIEVAAHVFRKREDTMLLLVGDGALRPSIEQSCADLGIRSRVIFTGVSSRVPELMRSAMDVFVMPSLHEGLPLVLLEAQAAGLPCLVSDVVSHEALVSDGAIQFLPLSSGAAAWADAVFPLLDSRPPNLLERMWDTDFNIVVSAKRLMDLYDAAYRGCTEGC